MSASTAHAERNEPKEFLVTAFSKKPAGRNAPSRDILWSEVWHAGTPLPVGYPFRWVLQTTPGGVRVRDLGKDGAEVFSRPAEEIPYAELGAKGVIELSDDRNDWRCWVLIQPVHELRELERRAGAGEWVPTVIPPPAVSESAAQVFLKKTSIGVSAAMFLMLVSVFLVPKPDPKKEELIPEQFAKVILSPALKSSSKSSSESAGGPASNNVVQAFKSEAVQKTTKTLFSAKAANRLLSGSTLLNTAQSSAAARSLFDAKSALTQNVPKGKLEVGARAVGMVGGKSGAVGYSGGGGAAVEGQGSGSVNVAGEGMGVSEGLTKNEVGKVIREHMAEVRYCYESGLIRNPSLEGKVVINFVVSPSGAVSTGKVKETSGDNVLDQCILGKLLKWKFPKPRGGVGVDISYPFIFKVLGG